MKLKRSFKVAFKWLKDKYPLLIIGVMFILLTFLVHDYLFMRIILIYCSIFIFAKCINFPDNKFGNTIQIVIYVPYLLMTLIVPFAKLFFLFIAGFLMPYAIIAIIQMKTIPFLFGYKINGEAIVYITLSLGSILVLLFGERIIRLLNENQDYHKGEERIKKQLDFISLFLNKGIVQISLYSMYFVTIILSSIINFSDVEIAISKNIMTAVIQSFATFIAFERVISKKDVLLKIKYNFWKNFLLLIINYLHLDKDVNNSKENSNKTEKH